MNVVATLIVYDTDPEHKKLAALFDSTENAGTTSYVIAVDTKSVAGTEDWIRAKVSGDIFPYTFEDDFAAARNLTLARLPEETDFWFWIDSDDTLEMTEGKTLPEFLGEVPSNVNAVGFLYDYEHDQYGNKTTTHRRGRLYRGSMKWEWRGAVHEDVYPVDHVGRPLALKSEDFLWVHHTEGRESSFDRNMRILQKEVAKNPDDPRTLYYVGNAHFAVRDFANAAAAYEKYVGSSGWDLERYMALIYQAMAYRELGLMEKALDADTRALHLFPDLADAYFGIGETYTRQRQWKKGLHFGELGMKAVADGGIPDADMFINLNAYAYKPYMWMADCYLELGMNERALESLEAAAKQRPEEDLLRGIDHIKWAMKRRAAMDKILWLAGYLRDINEPLKALDLLKHTPAGGQEDGRIAAARRLLYKEVDYLYDPVAYRNHYFETEDHDDPLDLLEKVPELFPRIDWVLRKLKQAGAKKVLEIGVGNALTTLYYATHGIQVVGMDIDRRRVKNANFLAVRAGLLTTKTVDFGDAEDPYPVEVPDISPSSPFQVHWGSHDDVNQAVLDLGPFDAVLATELIEHMLDPKGLLDALDGLAPRVILTTPDGAYEGPQARNLDHVRAYSLKELAAEVLPRGSLIDIHKLKHPKGEYDNLMAQYLPGQTLPEKSVIIWCFDTGQGWTPDSIREGGIGGSETAVIRVSEELVKKGYRVTVYAECEGVWNGVRYAKSNAFRPQPCDLFVSWRSLGPLDAMKDLAQYRMLWCHDIHAGDIPSDKLEGVTVLALSEWHRTFLEEKYPGARVVLSGNGIDPERFDKVVAREQHRLIYAQSPDRGLDIVLETFPKIRAKYPDASLHVYYGFDLARQRMPEYVAHIEQLAKQEGVTLHGRVGQDELAEAYLKSDAMLYPAVMPNGEPFDETYCISVVEALAAGCFPITGDHGALRYTNQGGAFYRHPVWDDAVRELFAFWDRPLKEQSRIRDHGHVGKDPTGLSGRRWAVEQTWENVAQGWVALTETEVETSLPELADAYRT